MSVAIELSKRSSSPTSALTTPSVAGKDPGRELKIGLIMMLASFPLFFPFIFRFLAVILFFGGLIIYADGLLLNKKWERAKKQARVAQDSTSTS